MKGSAELYRCPENFPRRAIELVVEPIRSMTRAVTASFPNDDPTDGCDIIRGEAWPNSSTYPPGSTLSAPVGAAHRRLVSTSY
jgi:hypothetical protein